MEGTEMKQFITIFKKFTKTALILLALSVMGIGLQGEALAKRILRLKVPPRFCP